MAYKMQEIHTEATNLDRVLAEITENTIIEVGIRHVTLAKALAPVREGQLRNSLSVINAKGEQKKLNDGTGKKADGLSNDGLKDGEVYAGSAVEHALYQEYGTKRMIAQPFLRPAAERIINGSTASSVMKKYERKQMETELKTRKQVRDA